MGGVLITGCSKDDSLNQVYEKCPDLIETKKLKSRLLNYSESNPVLCTWEYNSKGWEMGYTEEGGVLIEHRNYQHDNRGNVVFYERYTDGILRNTKKRTFNEYKLVTSDSLFNELNEAIQIELWGYDGQNLTNYKWLVPQNSGEDHVHLEHKNYKYDENNRLLSYDVYKSKTHDLTTTYHYDPRGILYSIKSERVWDEYVLEELMMYNEDCLTSDLKIMIRGELRYHFTNYAYNENGSYVYREFYANGSLSYTEERTFE